MDVKKIELLLEKYFNAESTLEEEQLLRQWLSDPKKLPAHLRTYCFWFEALEEEARRTTSAAFAQKLQQKIRQSPDTKTTIARIRLLWQPIVQIAAVGLILLLALFTLKRPHTPPNSSSHQLVVATGEIEDPELAYQQTMAALAFLTSQMDQGRRKAAKELQRVEIIEQVIKTN